MQYKVKKNTKSAVVSSCVLFACSIIMFMTSAYTEFKLINQLLGFFAIILCIQIILRYILSDYVYVITDDSDIHYLEIFKVSNKKSTKLCSVSFENAIALIKKDKTVNLPKKYGKITHGGSFVSNMMTKDLYFFIFGENGQLTQIILECDQTFAQYLLNEINYVKGDDDL